ncbi:uncharacterized protein [Anoplolepis gracilipes]|uniref:uncharacterized protein isoform X2 n=1 Tax=Anoplolepis gracilipes TaxID=354296 RepID=UPI003BA33AF4
MTVGHKSSSAATVKETPEDDYIYPELKLLQTIAVQSTLGQTVLRFADNFLWTVEKCAEWSLPCQEIAEDENGKSSEKSEFVRPLPWIFFLPSLMMLRTIRMTINVGAFIMGYSRITPSSLVKFLQLSRTRLNNIKNSGTREKQDKDEKSSMNEARRILIKSIRLTLSSLSCLDTSEPIPSPPPTKIHVSSVLDPETATTTSEEKSGTESTDATEKQGNLISYSESEEDEKEMKNDEEEETLKEKIDRLALETSDEDEDFDPANCSVSSNESNDKDNEDDDNDEVDEDDGNVSSTELRDIIEDANLLLGRTTTVQNMIEQFQAAERNAAQVCDQDQRLLAKESRDKVEERFSQRIDSPTCYTSDRSSQEGDSIFYSPISSDSDTPKTAIAEKTSKTSGAANNGAVVEKRSTNVSKCHKGKRTSHGNRRKK